MIGSHFNGSAVRAKLWLEDVAGGGMVVAASSSAEEGGE